MLAACWVGDWPRAIVRCDRCVVSGDPWRMLVAPMPYTTPAEQVPTPPARAIIAATAGRRRAAPGCCFAWNPKATTALLPFRGWRHLAD